MEQSLREFYKGKRVLLTGHTGFKGTWMSLMLEELGAVVCGYSLPLPGDSFYEKVMPVIVTHIEGDIADADKVWHTVSTFQPEIIFHLASHSSLEGNTTIPDFILRTNLMGVMNVLEAARKSDCVKAAVIVTSDKCYANLETDIPYKEDSLLDARDPYSTSKVCQELLTKCYRETFFSDREPRLTVATARASNVIGAGDYNLTRLLPYLLETYSSGKTPEIRNPQAVRPWQYVLDVLEGYLILGEKLYASVYTNQYFDGAYNFGPDEDGFVTVEKMTEMLGEAFYRYDNHLSRGFRTVDCENARKAETKILKLDSTKAHDRLGWKCKTSLPKAFEMIVDFIMREKETQNADELSRAQMKEFLSLS